MDRRKLSDPSEDEDDKVSWWFSTDINDIDNLQTLTRWKKQSNYRR